MPTDQDSAEDHPLKVTSPRLEKDRFTLTPSAMPGRPDARRAQGKTKSRRAGPEDTESEDDETEQATLVTDGGRDTADIQRLESGRPLGMSTPAWKGCTCPACRSERRRFFGREDVDKGQSTLGGA